MLNAERTTNDLVKYLRDLQLLSVSMCTYTKEVRAGRLPRLSPGWHGLLEAEDHPGHPLSAHHRFSRMRIARAVCAAARGRSEPFPPGVLYLLHRCLCDCCAEVREALTEALFHAGDATSVEPLKSLLRHERRVDPTVLERSETVRRYARAALGRCRGRDPGPFTLGVGRLLVISDDIAFVCDLQDLAWERGLLLFQGHSGIDLIGVPCIAQVADPALCAPDEWAGYLEYLHECAEPAEPDTTLPGASVDPGGCFSCPNLSGELSDPDTTPLLLVNTESEWAIEHGGRILKPYDTVFCFASGCEDEALRALRAILGQRL